MREISVRWTTVAGAFRKHSDIEQPLFVRSKTTALKTIPATLGVLDTLITVCFETGCFRCGILGYDIVDAITSEQPDASETL